MKQIFKLLIIFSILTSSLFGESKENINATLETIAKEISDEQTKLSNLNKEITELEKEINLFKNEFSEKEKDRDILKKEKSLEIERRNILEKKMVNLVSKELLLSSIVVQKGDITNEKDLVRDKAFVSLNAVVKKDTKELKEKLQESEEKIKNIDLKIKEIKKTISKLEEKRKSLRNLKDSKLQTISKLNLRKKNYNKKLQNILQEEKKRRAEIEKAKKLAKNSDEKEETKTAKDKDKKLSEEFDLNDYKISENFDVKRYNSSFKATKTYHYRGKKLPPPLDNFVVTKKFGTYTDPIYKIKIQNDSISMSPKNGSNSVKAVMDGKIVFSKKTPSLGKVVIIRHPNGLHTIYANLSTISENAKRGNSISQGNTIGTVSRELIFEVTRNNFLINPLELIKH